MNCNWIIAGWAGEGIMRPVLWARSELTAQAVRARRWPGLHSVQWQPPSVAESRVTCRVLLCVEGLLKSKKLLYKWSQDLRVSSQLSVRASRWFSVAGTCSSVPTPEWFCLESRERAVRSVVSGEQALMSASGSEHGYWASVSHSLLLLSLADQVPGLQVLGLLLPVPLAPPHSDRQHGAGPGRRVVSSDLPR